MELSILPPSILTLLLNLMVIVNLSDCTVRVSDKGRLKYSLPSNFFFLL